MHEKIIKTIKEYINNKNDNSAIMINGSWGSGKTYFIKNVLKSEISNIIYVPLYGVSNIEEIDEKICNEIIKNKKNKVVGNETVNILIITLKNAFWFIYKPAKKVFQIIGTIINNFKNFIIELLGGALKVKLGVDLKAVKKRDFVGIINQTTNLSDYVLVFDDLERCKIEIEIIFGFINNFVEHKKVKTIIISNEDEIKKELDNNYELKVLSVLNNDIKFPKGNKTIDIKDIYGEKSDDKDKIDSHDISERIKYLYSDNTKYKKTKEKIISKTIRYIPDILGATMYFKNSYSKEVNELIDEQEVKKVMEENECENLRTLKVALNHFEFIYLHSKKEVCKIFKYKSKNIFNLILKNTIVVTIAQKNGIFIPKILNGKLYEKKSILNDYTMLNNNYEMFSFVNDYISSGYFDEEVMKKSLKYYNDTRTTAISEDDPYYIIDRYWYCEDGELKSALQKLEKNLLKSSYNYNLYPKMLAKLSSLISIDFETELINKIINEMIESIKGKNIDYIDFHTIIEDAEALQIYNKFVSKFEQEMSSSGTAIYKNKIETALESKNWGKKLYEYSVDCKDKGILARENGFLSKININKLKEAIDNSDTENIYEFRRTIYNVYYYINDFTNFKNDLYSLNELIDFLELKQTSYGKLKNLGISYLINDLKIKKDKIQNLK